MTEYVFYNNGDSNKILVNPDCIYWEKQGFGFFTEETVKSDKRYSLTELNTGFEKEEWFAGEVRILQDEYGCYVDSLWRDGLRSYQEILEDGVMKDGVTKSRILEDCRLPLSFKADIGEKGFYQVTVTVYAVEEEEVLIYLGRRHLAYRGRLKAGERYCRTFPVFICDIIPRGETDRYHDQEAEVTVIGNHVRLAKVSIERGNGRTFFLAGDSTVTDQSAKYPYRPEVNYGGWGQMISFYLNGEGAVSNHAHSGLTTESFRSEGHYEIMMDYVRPGDICAFQFGHNDQKLAHLKAEEGYRNNLMTYIREVREKQAIPVLITSLARNSWKGADGTYNDLLKEYSDVVKRIGEEEGVPVLDLHQRSMEFIKEHGLQDSKRWFYPSDYTHTNDYGAYLMAYFVWEELKKVGLVESGGKAEVLKAEIVESYGNAGEAENGGNAGFTPASWIPPQIIEVLDFSQFSASESNNKKLSEGLERPEDYLTRAEALDLVIKAVNFFPTNVYNDLFTDVIGHEWYAGSVECGIQNGLIPSQMVENHTFCPDRFIALEEFLWIAITAYKSRKEVPSPEHFPKGTKDWTGAMAGSACAMGLVSEQENWAGSITRQEAANLLDRLII